MAQPSKRPRYEVMNGIRYPGLFSPQCFRDALDCQHKPGDVFIITYPKCGTTWIQNIALYIFRKGRPLENTNDFLKHCPFIDFIGQEGMDKMPRPGVFKTHIPFNYLNTSSQAKYIFAIRDPKDCCVSFYHHTKGQPAFCFWDATFDEFFELFMAGKVEYNEYFDHLMSWYHHRTDPNVFYTKYEDMKKDTRSTVINLATFLGDEYIEAIEKDNAVLRNILHYSGFDYMKENFKSYNFKEMSAKKESILQDPNVYEGIKYGMRFLSSLDVPDVLPKQEFIRKGQVGDWRNYFSVEQLERLNAKFLERTAGTDVQEWYPLGQ